MNKEKMLRTLAKVEIIADVLRVNLELDDQGDGFTFDEIVGGFIMLKVLVNELAELAKQASN